MSVDISELFERAFESFYSGLTSSRKNVAGNRDTWRTFFIDMAVITLANAMDHGRIGNFHHNDTLIMHAIRSLGDHGAVSIREGYGPPDSRARWLEPTGVTTDLQVWVALLKDALKDG